LLDTENCNVELRRTKYDIDKLIWLLEYLKIPEPYIGALKYMFLNGSVPKKPNGTNKEKYTF
jgi:protein phosphatase